MHDDDRLDQWSPLSSLQQCYQQSQIERRGDDPEVRVELAKGKFVVAACVVEYCCFTDATLGHRTVFVSSHDTRTEAEARCLIESRYDCEDGFHFVLPEEPASPSQPEDVSIPLGLNEPLPF
jgi:hypothetical protein